METKNNSASALVVTLMFLVLITILVIGLMTTAGLERRTVQENSAKMQADLYSSMATDVVAARIQKATTLPDAWWISQPGRIAYEGATADDVEFSELHSGKADAVQTDISVNLNQTSLLSGRGLITDDPAIQMLVKWIYVREDGTLENDPTIRPAYSVANPIVGRYAFWTDDLSGRLNLNTITSSTDPDNEVKSHPSRVALDKLPTLTSADVSAMRTWRQNRLFESVAHAKAAAATVAWDGYKMDLTHYSHSPTNEENVFAEPKIVLTTQADRANGKPFFDILLTPNTDPGINTNINATKFNHLFAILYGYFSRKDWTLDSGKSFVDKYGPENTAQIILNLIDYVRSAESNEKIVEPSRGSFDAGAFAWGVAPWGDKALLGNARRPLITQMGVWISADRRIWPEHEAVEGDGGQALFEVRFRTEVYWPLSVGESDTTINLAASGNTMFNQIGVPGRGVVRNDDLDGIAYDQISSSHASIEGGGSVMAPGEYRTITMTFPATGDFKRPPGSPPAPRPAGTVYLRSTIRVAASSGLVADIAPLESDSTTAGMEKMAKYILDSGEVGSDSITAIFTNDPVINQFREDWGSQGNHSFGQMGKTPSSSPASTFGQARIAMLPQQDTDSDNKVTDEGFGFPAFKGTSKNPRGMVESLAELGRIHTGGKGVSFTGVPWRTLRLQPRDESDTSLPDWMLLDLFAVPSWDSPTPDARNRVVLHPHGTENTGGLINANIALYPFSDQTIPVVRIHPMAVVLQSNDSGRTPSAAEDVVDHMVHGVWADGPHYKGRFYGPAALEDTNLYFMHEQLVEIKGVADGGEGDEKKLDAWLPFLTVRGSVYTVFAVGQKIVQTPDGTIIVQSESRTETLLERKNGTVQVLSIKEMGL